MMSVIGSSLQSIWGMVRPVHVLLMLVSITVLIILWRVFHFFIHKVRRKEFLNLILALCGDYDVFECKTPFRDKRHLVDAKDFIVLSRSGVYGVSLSGVFCFKAVVCIIDKIGFDGEHVRHRKVAGLAESAAWIHCRPGERIGEVDLALFRELLGGKVEPHTEDRWVNYDN